MRNTQAAQKRVDEDSSFPSVPQQGRVTVMKGDGINTVVSFSNEIQNKNVSYGTIDVSYPTFSTDDFDHPHGNKQHTYSHQYKFHHNSPRHYQYSHRHNAHHLV
jgi:hypothetical protein